MLDVVRMLRQEPALTDLELVLTDLYPNAQAAPQVALKDFNDPSYTFEVTSRRVGRLPGPSFIVLGRPVVT